MAKKKKEPAYKRIEKAMPCLWSIQKNVNDLRIDCNNRELYACGIALQHIWEKSQELEQILNEGKPNVG